MIMETCCKPRSANIVKFRLKSNEDVADVQVITAGHSFSENEITPLITPSGTVTLVNLSNRTSTIDATENVTENMLYKLGYKPEQIVLAYVIGCLPRIFKDHLGLTSHCSTLSLRALK